MAHTKHSFRTGILLLGSIATTVFSHGQIVIPPSGIINTVAGNGTYGYSGDGGLATNAEVAYVPSIVVDSSGNLYIADEANQRIRKITASTGDISTVAGNGTAGYSGDGGIATSAELHNPTGVAVDSSGNLYIVDQSNSRVRKVTASTGDISTVAGNGTAGYSGDGGLATSVELHSPQSVAVGSSGNLYISDTLNYRIRKVTASTGYISTIAGTGAAGYSGDGGPATSATFYAAWGIAVDSSGNVYFADEQNCRIRQVTASTGKISTLAGNGTAGYSGDGGSATRAELNMPWGVAVDSSGYVYIADSQNNRVRMVSYGYINPIAGNGTAGHSGDGGSATSAEVSAPWAVAVDRSGNIYIADTHSFRVRAIGAE